TLAIRQVAACDGVVLETRATASQAARGHQDSQRGPVSVGTIGAPLRERDSEIMSAASGHSGRHPEREEALLAHRLCCVTSSLRGGLAMRATICTGVAALLLAPAGVAVA